jgi:hypothetical protein
MAPIIMPIPILLPPEAAQAYALTIATCAAIALAWGGLRAAVALAGWSSGATCGRRHCTHEDRVCVRPRGHLGQHRGDFDARGVATQWPRYMCDETHVRPGQVGAMGRTLVWLGWR